MRLLDLFCGAGGAAVGYHRAGFDQIVGVDIKPQPRYPFEFVQADAMTYPLEGFDAIHASPPCQSYSRAMRHLAAPQPKLVEATLGRLAGHVYVVENVPGVTLPTAIILCGSAFGLRVHRHRYFEVSLPMFSPGCVHGKKPAMNPHNVKGRALIVEEFGRIGNERVWADAMGVGWMNQHEAREAIPPAYTEYIGRALLAVLNERQEAP